MAKQNRTRKRMTGKEYLEYTKYILRDKCFNAWLKKYQFEGDEIDYKKNRFILKKYYIDGSICAFKSKLDTLEFAPFTPTGYDLYDMPKTCQLINKRNSPLIPVAQQVIDPEEGKEGVVISYLLMSRNSPYDTIEWYIEELALIKMIIRTNLYTHNMPWLLAISPTDQQRLKDILNKILDGDLIVGLDFADLDKLKVLNGGQNFIIDKLHKYKTDIENELKTFLGVNNTGVEKQERLLEDEVNANNEEIESNDDMFLSEMEEFCKRIEKTLGFKVSVKSLIKQAEEKSIEETRAGIHEQEEDNNDEL